MPDNTWVGGSQTLLDIRGKEWSLDTLLLLQLGILGADGKFIAVDACL